MTYLQIIWSSLWPTCLIFGAFASVVFAAFLYVLRYEIRTDPERMSARDGGGHPGQPGGRAALRAASTPGIAQPGPTQPPDLLATQCMTCRCVRCVDQRWLPEGMVPLPVGCRVSHGLCPACGRVAQAELDRVCPLPARSRNLQVALPTALPTAG